ncbi:MAG: hypothetical protein ABIS20_24330 [Thermoanaerobaculia bacterium]
MRKLLIVAIGVAAIVGCATVPTTPAATPHVGESPVVSNTVQRSVGETIYERYNYSQLSGARLTSAGKFDELAIHWTVQAGDFLPAFSDSTGSFYCTADSILHIPMSTDRVRVCLVDRNGDGKFDQWTAPEGPSGARIRTWIALNPPLSFTLAQGDAMSGVGHGYRYELLYEGISGNVVAILYREYVNDLARPAFQQDLHYTLEASGPTEVSFRGARIRIYSADNNALKYELLSGLRE